MLTDEQVILGSVMFLLLYSIPKDVPEGKRSRKYLVNLFKKRLGEHRGLIAKEDNKEDLMRNYLSHVEISSVLMKQVVESMKLEGDESTRGIVVTPSGLIRALEHIRPEIISVFEIEDRHVSDLEKVYINSNGAFRSRMYVNRLLPLIDEHLGNT